LVTPDSARNAFSTSENWVFACMGMAVEIQNEKAP
jgi:hypothetical protein